MPLKEGSMLKHSLSANHYTIEEYEEILKLLNILSYNRLYLSNNKLTLKPSILKEVLYRGHTYILLYETHYEDLPLYINNEIVGKVASYRLLIGK